MFDLVPFNRRRRGMTNSDDFLTDFFKNFGELSTNWSASDFKTDIRENENEYVVQAELPGVNKDNINIELNDDYMTITATNNEVIEDENDNYIRRERRTGSFQRSFYIKDVKADEIDASYNDGILEIKLPKKNPGKRVRKIDIH